MPFNFTTHAQTVCPDVDAMTTPVDMGAFTMVQDYGARSPRHNGRYHTGEDWALPDATAFGQPVRAIATGTVTYAYGQGWGRDGGVVILEHTMSDESIIYSVYGHLIETDATPFPAGGACVEAGEVIGSIGEVRPTAHLHFEIRVSNGRTPGHGYTWDYPDAEGYRRPAKFLLNWQARLNRTVSFVSNLRVERGYHAPPLPLSDNSLVFLNETEMFRILPDGRQFWRKGLDRPAVALTGFQGQSYLHYTDGIVQNISADGDLLDSWQTFTEVAGAPFTLDGNPAFPAAAGGLLALDMRLQQIVWEAADIPLFDEAWVGLQTIAVRTHNSELVTFARNSGDILDRARVGLHTDLTVRPDGTLWVYSSGGLWQVLADGVWVPTRFDVPLPESTGAIATGEDSDLLLFDGTHVRSYGSNNVEQWAYEVLNVNGRVKLAYEDGRALLYSTGGDIVSVSPLGKTCRVRVWGGGESAYLWHALGTDDVMRVQIGGSLAGLRWERFSRECA
ncbi:MAG: M23 family metallopeptidase [Chloroflexota bacterium]